MSKWLEEARLHLGLKEIPGDRHNTTIQGWLTLLGAWWRDDETPWCGVFVAHCMRAASVPLPKHWYRAQGWLDWGKPLQKPVPGCVVILAREGGGHVFLATGRMADGRIVGIGGNQGNAVTEAAFDPARILGLRWPSGWLLPKTELPLVTQPKTTSNHEG